MFSFNVAIANPVTVTVVFENLTEQTTVNGIFYITETNQQFDITTLASFTIDLPKKGKYEFRFHSEEVTAFTYYPARITKKTTS
ncbi:hypothetical protein [Gelidibacter salicanalis]|uniref:Uncharacterized protein n=1 Tax=Gelidibacter salicanalis TaxID=291193 RepID=A0A934KV95_9FLAO|nr:hypothetical protein [Gelidibacter salicanalis]MBJ7880883.1 hypothetical protein [Gelidibacter salicanalis]